MVPPIPPVPALPLTPAPGRMGVDFERRVDFARLEEELVVTATGAEIITRFPSRDLFVTNPY